MPKFSAEVNMETWNTARSVGYVWHSPFCITRRYTGTNDNDPITYRSDQRLLRWTEVELTDIRARALSRRCIKDSQKRRCIKDSLLIPGHSDIRLGTGRSLHPSFNLLSFRLSKADFLPSPSG